jgi:hypothetical protein
MPDDPAQTRARLLSGEAALQAFAERMQRERFDPQADGVQVLGD